MRKILGYRFETVPENGERWNQGYFLRGEESITKGIPRELMDTSNVKWSPVTQQRFARQRFTATKPLAPAASGEITIPNEDEDRPRFRLWRLIIQQVRWSITQHPYPTTDTFNRSLSSVFNQWTSLRVSWSGQAAHRCVICWLSAIEVSSAVHGLRCVFSRRTLMIIDTFNVNGVLVVIMEY